MIGYYVIEVVSIVYVNQLGFVQRQSPTIDKKPTVVNPVMSHGMSFQCLVYPDRYAPYRIAAKILNFFRLFACAHAKEYLTL